MEIWYLVVGWFCLILKKISKFENPSWESLNNFDIKLPGLKCQFHSPLFPGFRPHSQRAGDREVQLEALHQDMFLHGPSWPHVWDEIPSSRNKICDPLRDRNPRVYLPHDSGPSRAGLWCPCPRGLLLLEVNDGSDLCPETTARYGGLSHHQWGCDPGPHRWLGTSQVQGLAEAGLWVCSRYWTSSSRSWYLRNS